MTAVSFHFHGYQPGDIVRCLEADPLRIPRFEERNSPVSLRIGTELVAGRNWTDSVLRAYGRMQAVLDRTAGAASVDIEPQTLVWLLERDPDAYARIVQAYERGTAGFVLTPPFHPILPHHHAFERETLFDIMIDFYAPILRRVPTARIGLWLPETGFSSETLASFVDAARRAELEHEDLGDLAHRIHVLLDSRQLVKIPEPGNGWVRLRGPPRVPSMVRDHALSGDFAFGVSDASAIVESVRGRRASALLVASDLESLLANPVQAGRYESIVEGLRTNGIRVAAALPPDTMPDEHAVEFSSWSDYDEHAVDGHTSDTRWTGLRRVDGLVISRVHRNRPLSQLWKVGFTLATARIETAVRRTARRILRDGGIGKPKETLRRLAVAYARQLFRSHYRAQRSSPDDVDLEASLQDILHGRFDVERAALVARGYCFMLMGLRSDPRFWEHPDTRVTFQNVALLAQALVDISGACQRSGDSSRAGRQRRLLRATLLEFPEWHGRREFKDLHGVEGWETTEAAWHESLQSAVPDRSVADVIRRATAFALQDSTHLWQDEVRTGGGPPVADSGHIVGEAHGAWENKVWCEHRLP